jgi:RimJ/RimL family protein N-acetyltransferase
MNLKKSLTGAVRGSLRLLAGDYQLWRIYSILASQCCEPDGSFEIRPIDDLDIFTRPELEEPLQRANWYKLGAYGYAAWSGSQLQGVCWFWPGPLLASRNIGMQPDNCAELIQITVAQRAQGKGVGPALINFGGRRLQEAGFRRLYAQIWRTNTASVRAFEKVGWKQVGWFLQCQPLLMPKKITLRWAFREPDLTSNDVLSNWRVSGSTN